MENSGALERITLRNTASEKIGEIAFNPHDPKIAWRMQSVTDVTDAILSPLTQISIHRDGTAEGASAESYPAAERGACQEKPAQEITPMTEAERVAQQRPAPNG